MGRVYRRVLIIDDSPVIRQILRLQLEEHGWRVHEAVNAYEGLNQFREAAPQLILLDLLMPLNEGIDALQLAEMIQQEDPAATLLIFSSFGAKPDLQAHFKKRQIDLFEKPSADNPNSEELFERIGLLARQLDAEDEKSRN